MASVSSDIDGVVVSGEGEAEGDSSSDDSSSASKVMFGKDTMSRSTFDIPS